MNEFLLIISISLLIVSLIIYFKKGFTSNKAIKIIFCLLFYFSVFFYTFYFLADFFTGKGITPAVFYHIKFGLLNESMLNYLTIIFVLISIFIINTLFVFLIFIYSGEKKDKINKNTILIVSLLLLSIITNPTTLALGSEIYSEIRLKINYINIDINTDFEFLDYYYEPYLEKINDTRNFVFIYLESFERTFFDDIYFPNLANNLKEIEKESISFTDIGQNVRGGWTMGGLVASLCGIPLFSPGNDNSLINIDNYLSNAICITDLLSDEGYFLSYLGGAHLGFGSKGHFLNSHSFDIIKGFDEFIEQLDDINYRHHWGLYDDTLLDLAFKEYLELSQKEKPFGLFLLTVDTHAPRGYISRSCENLTYKDSSNQILNAIHCSDLVVSNFIRKVQNSEFGNDTIIIIVSDHLMHKSTASDILDKLDRRNLFMILTPERDHKLVETAGTTMDFSPTIIKYIGFNGEIGFGRDLISTKNFSEETRFRNRFNEWRFDITNYFWNIPRIRKRIYVNKDLQTLFIDNMKLKYPLFLKIHDNLITSVELKRDDDVKVDLLRFTENIKENEFFLLIDRCHTMHDLEIYSSADLSEISNSFCIYKGTIRNKTINKLENSFTLHREFFIEKIRQ